MGGCRGWTTWTRRPSTTTRGSSLTWARPPPQSSRCWPGRSGGAPPQRSRRGRPSSTRGTPATLRRCPRRSKPTSLRPMRSRRSPSLRSRTASEGVRKASRGQGSSSPPSPRTARTAALSSWRACSSQTSSLRSRTTPLGRSAPQRPLWPSTCSTSRTHGVSISHMLGRSLYNLPSKTTSRAKVGGVSLSSSSASGRAASRLRSRTGC
mmetsp:Transcript_22534/g.54202  ORF Transcript_22534/g.54202 Transcript_22534/m.54202 type:complete len:208 (-) Transcript_22534:3688-4311(-)